MGFSLWGASVKCPVKCLYYLRSKLARGASKALLQVVVFVLVAGRLLKRAVKGCFASFWGEWCGRLQAVCKGPLRLITGLFSLHLEGLRAGLSWGMALTEKQAAFVGAFVGQGLSATEAATVAGYGSPRVEGWSLLRVPAVQAEIAKARAALISGDGARLAWRTMARLMEDGAGSPPAVQFQAARWVLEASGQGLAARIAERGVEPERALAEMSLGELEGFIARGRAALSGLRSAAAPVVDVAALPPSDPASDPA